ncbi:hypothetical protein RQP46_010327 [Phenoliferia psychrophenolica]
MVDDAPESLSPSPSPSPPAILACDTPPAYLPHPHPAPAPNVEDESPPKKVKCDEPEPEVEEAGVDGSQLETAHSSIKEDSKVAKAKSVVVGDFGGEGMLMSGGWLVSAAIEGVRVVWDEKTFVREVGTRVLAPVEFTKDLPKGYSFDGVLVSTDPRVNLKKAVVIHWFTVRYKIFDSPSLAHLPFSERLAKLKSLFSSPVDDDAPKTLPTTDATDATELDAAATPAPTNVPTPDQFSDSQISDSQSQPESQLPAPAPAPIPNRGRSQSISHGSLPTAAASQLKDNEPTLDGPIKEIEPEEIQTIVVEKRFEVVEQTLCEDVKALQSVVEDVGTSGGNAVFARKAESLYVKGESADFVRIACEGLKEDVVVVA